MTASVADVPSDVLAQHHGRFLAFLRQRVENDAVAEDILQDAYAKSLQRLDQVRNDESVVAWFYQLLRNALADHYRKAGAERKAKEVRRGREKDCPCLHDGRRRHT
jgi:RNA polymerase sigma factor (sigma-70 family)